MALTGRLALVAALAAAAMLLVPTTGALVLLVNAVLLALVLVDIALAASVGSLALSRQGARATRLGEPATVSLLVSNSGRRPARTQVRDAWSPSAGATPRVHTVTVPPGERRRVDTLLHPTRRGDRHPS